MSSATPRAVESDVRDDARTIALIGAGHFVSHFLQLALPPLFPILREEFDVSYTALGLLMSVFFVASGVGQTAAGFVVDRLGAARVLLGGMGVFAAAIALAGVSPSYWFLMATMLLAGLGNAVFHPANYAILNASVDSRRLGRAYSVHGISGNLGWAATPVVIVTLSHFFGWRAALLVLGGAGVAITLALAPRIGTLAARRDGPAVASHHGLHGSVRLLLSTPILVAFAYFVLIATSLIGLQSFSVAAIVRIYEVPLALATSALTALLLGSAAGILTGGFLADRTSRHDIVAASGMTAAAMFALVMASAALPAALIAATMALLGFCLGCTHPSRDMLVHAATPVGASGKVFGFVYSGLDLGASLTPLVFGWLMDRGEPRAVFFVAAGVMLLTIVTVVQVRRHRAPVTARR